MIRPFGQGGQPHALVSQIVSHYAHHIACTLPTHHEMASISFNLLVAFNNSR